MTKREITLLCFKLLGAYAFLLAVADTRGFAFILTMAPGGREGMVSIVSRLVAAFGPLILLSMAAFILWFKADYFAERIFSPESGSAGKTFLSAQEWQLVAFRVLGMFVLVGVLPMMVRVLVLFLAEADGRAMSQRLTTDRMVELGRFVAQTGAGLWLLFSNDGLQKLMTKIQGIRDQQEEPTETHV